MLELSARDHPQLKAKRLFYEAPRSCPGEGKGSGLCAEAEEGAPKEAAPKVCFAAVYDALWRPETKLLTTSSHPFRPHTQDVGVALEQAWLLGGEGGGAQQRSPLTLFSAWLIVLLSSHCFLLASIHLDVSCQVLP